MSDRTKASFEALVRSALPRVDYCALYPAKVVAQNADGTLELQPDDARFPGLSGIPLRLGLPGVSVKVSGGARVLLAFENGDPSRPTATLWEASGLTELIITASVKVTVNAPAVALGDGLKIPVCVGDTITGLANGGGPVTGIIAATPVGPATKVKV